MWLNIGLTQPVLRIFTLNFVQTCLEAPGNGKRLLLTSLKACDWSGHICGASASPRSSTKNSRMHNASRSLQSGVSTIQPDEPTAAQVFDTKYILARKTLIISSATPRLPSASAHLRSTCHPPYHVSSLVGMFVLLWGDRAETEYPLAGLPIKLVLGVTFFRVKMY